MIAIKEQSVKMLAEEFGISSDVAERLFEEGIITTYTARNALIKREYKSRMQPKEKQRVKGGIAQRFCISVELVEKIIKSL